MAQIYSRGEGVNRGDLHIKSVTYEERGLYKCTVMTKSDLATRSAEVTVRGRYIEMGLSSLCDCHVCLFSQFIRRILF